MTAVLRTLVCELRTIFLAVLCRNFSFYLSCRADVVGTVSVTKIIAALEISSVSGSLAVFCTPLFLMMYEFAMRVLFLCVWDDCLFFVVTDVYCNIRLFS